MTDTTLVQGDFAPADTSIAAVIAEQSTLDTSIESTSEAVTAEPNGFIELGLAPELVQAVADLGYTQPTSVQLKAIPLAMGSDASKFIDLMVSSQTGSGKTAAFLLPVLHTLINQQAEAEAEERAAFDRAVAEAAARGEPAPKRAKRKDPTSSRNFKAATPGALILCPTRELAQQVAHDAIDLVKHCRGLRIDDFEKFLTFFKDAGYDLDAKDAQGNDFIALIQDQRLAEPYVEAVKAAKA